MPKIQSDCKDQRTAGGDKHWPDSRLLRERRITLCNRRRGFPEIVRRHDSTFFPGFGSRCLSVLVRGAGVADPADWSAEAETTTPPLRIDAVQSIVDRRCLRVSIDHLASRPAFGSPPLFRPMPRVLGIKAGLDRSICAVRSLVQQKPP